MNFFPMPTIILSYNDLYDFPWMIYIDLLQKISTYLSSNDILYWPSSLIDLLTNDLYSPTSRYFYWPLSQMILFDLSPTDLSPPGMASLFLESPRDVSVLQGHVAVLKCKVTHSGVTVQWSMNGFALGVDREVEGFPRYSYIGRAWKGEFSLDTHT